MDYKEIQRWIQTKIDRNHYLFFPSSWNLVQLYNTKDSQAEHLIRAIDDVKRKQDAKILVVGSASLDYLFHLQILTGKPVYGIDLSYAVVKDQVKKIQSIRKSNDYDELQKKIDPRFGHFKIKNFREKNPFGHISVWIPFEKLQRILYNIHPIRADAHTQPFDDETFDLTFFDSTIDYSPYPVEFFKDCIRSLNKGGHLFMTTTCFYEARENEHASRIYTQILKESKKVSNEIIIDERTLYLTKRSN